MGSTLSPTRARLILNFFCEGLLGDVPADPLIEQIFGGRSHLHHREQPHAVLPRALGGSIVITRVVWLFLLALVTTTTAALARQQVVTRPRGVSAGADQQIIREVIEMERQSKEATLHRDADFTRRTLADDYVAITPLGQVTTKDDAIAARKSGQLRYEAMNISEMVVRIYGDTAVVTARAEVRGHQLGEDFSGPYRYTRIWVRHNGHWQTVSYQATVTQ